MYIISTSHIDPKSGTVYFSSTAGKWAGQHPRTGYVPNGTVLQGHLLACVDGLQKMRDMFESNDLTFCDILIDDETEATQFRDLICSPRTPKVVDPVSWNRFIELSRQYDLRIVSHVAESPHLETVWQWSSASPLPSTVPSSRKESDERLAAKVQK